MTCEAEMTKSPPNHFSDATMSSKKPQEEQIHILRSLKKTNQHVLYRKVMTTTATRRNLHHQEVVAYIS
jgi:hypothetical protein